MIYGYTYPCPAYVVTRYSPEAPLDQDQETLIERIMEHTGRIREIAKENEEKYKAQKEKEANKKAKDHTFETGDLVYQKIPKVLKYGKLKPRYDGPYQLTEDYGPHFGVKGLNDDSTIDKVHARRLKPAKVLTSEHLDDPIEPL